MPVARHSRICLQQPIGQPNRGRNEFRPDLTRSAIGHSCRPSNARGLPCRSWDTPSSTAIYVRASSLAIFSPFLLFSLVSRQHPLPHIGGECLQVNRTALHRSDNSSPEAWNRSVPVFCGSYGQPFNPVCRCGTWPSLPTHWLAARPRQGSCSAR